MDSYYLPDGNDIINTPAGLANFDHPEAFDWELLRAHLTQLSSGQTIEATLHTTSLQTQEIKRR